MYRLRVDGVSIEIWLDTTKYNEKHDCCARCIGGKEVAEI
jgi:hypothetical protein